MKLNRRDTAALMAVRLSVSERATIGEEVIVATFVLPQHHTNALNN